MLRKIRLIHIAWLLLFTSVYVWRMRSATKGMQVNLDNASYLRMALFGLGSIITLGYYIVRPQSISAFSKSLFVLLLLFVLSAYVSIAASPNSLYTLWKASEVSIDVMLLAVIFKSESLFKTIESLTKLTVFFFGLFVVGVWVQVALIPGKTVDHAGLLGFQFRSLYPLADADGVGNMSCLLAIFCLNRILSLGKSQGRKLYIMAFIAFFVTFFISQARTAMIAFVLSSAIVLIAYKKGRWFFVAICLGVIMLLSSTVVSHYATKYVVRDSTPKAMRSLSGRVYVWEKAYKSFQRSPLIGYGFATGTRYAISSGTGFAHNSFIEVLVNAGLLGFLSYLSIFVMAWFTLFRFWNRVKGTPQRQQYVLMTSLLAIVSVSSMTASSISNHDQIFMLYLLIVGYAQALKSNILRARQPVGSTGGYAAVAKPGGSDYVQWFASPA